MNNNRTRTLVRWAFWTPVTALGLALIAYGIGAWASYYA